MDDWEDRDPNVNVDPNELAKAAALCILISKKQEEIKELSERHKGNLALLLKREESYYNSFLKRKEFIERKRRSSEKHIESQRRQFWIPEATAQKKENIDNGTQQLELNLESAKEQIEIQLLALQRSLNSIHIGQDRWVSRIVKLYSSKFCSRERFVPQPGTRGGIANVDLSLVPPHVLPPSFSRLEMSNLGHILDAQDVDTEGINQFDLGVLQKVALIVRESATNWMDAAYEETFHWHSGKPLDEYTTFLSDYRENGSTATFFWHYGRSLEISLKPPEALEFSQHLRIQLQIQPQKFPEGNPKKEKHPNSNSANAKNSDADPVKNSNSKSAKNSNSEPVEDSELGASSAKAKNAKSDTAKAKNSNSDANPDKANEKKSKKAKPGSNSAKNATSAQWKVLVSNSSNLLSKPRADTINEARKLVLQMVGHPMAPSNKDRNLEAAKIMVQILRWQIDAVRGNKNATPHDKVQLFTTIRDLHVNFLPFLDKEGLHLVEEGIKILNGCSARFQMEECGAFLLKNANPQYFSHPDIPFIPDAWQKEVLEKIDENCSCLIVAPTSAGKSFISFYTISQVLKKHVTEDPTNIKKAKKKATDKEKVTSEENKPNSKGLQARVVFVAPTLPLCNQTIAVVRHRYNQNIQVGVFTAEYRFNVLSCEVLVCTPIIFEILLMSPSCEKWRENLKYVILDEIHYTSSNRRKGKIVATDEQEEDQEADRAMSDAYSRIFAILECPFLALSATVQNPENTRAWLQNIRNFCRIPGTQESQVHLLPSNYATLKRWVDLQSYVFISPAHRYDDVLQPFQLTQAPTTGKLCHLHPISFLRVQGETDFSSVSLSPLETMQLYDKIADVVGREKVPELDPENLRQQSRFIDTAQCAEYGRLLLTTLSQFSPEIRRSISKKFPFPFLMCEIEPPALAKNITTSETEKIGENIESKENSNNNNNNNNNSLKNEKANEIPKEYSSVRLKQKYHMAHLISHLLHSNMLPAIAFSDNTRFIESSFEEIVEYLEQLEAKFGKKPEITEKFKKKDERSEREYQEEEEGEEERAMVDRRKLEREIKKQSLDARLEVVHTQVWPVDFNYSLRKRTDSLDSEGISYWVSRMLSKLDMKANNLYIRGLARGIAIYHSGVPKPYRDLVEALFRSGNIQFVISTQALAVGVNMPCKSVVFYTDSEYINKVEFEQMRGRAGRRGFDHAGNTIFCHFSLPRIASLLLSPMQPLLAIPALNIDSVLRAIILQSKVSDRSSVSRAVGRWLYTNPSMETLKEANPPAVFLFAIELLFRLHLINKQAQPVGLSGLVAHNFDVYPANYVVSYLIQLGALDRIVEPFRLTSNSSKEDRKQTLISLISIFAYVAARVVVKKDPNSPNQPTARVLLPLPDRVVTALVTYNSIISDCVSDCSLALHTTNLPAPLLDLVPPSTLNSYAVDFFKYKSLQSIIKDNHLSDNYAYRLVSQFSGFLRKIKTAVAHGVSDQMHPLSRATTKLANKFYKYVDNIDY